MDLTDTMKHLLSNSGTGVGGPTANLSASNLTTSGGNKSSSSSSSALSGSSAAQNAATAAASLHHMQHQMHASGSSAVASTSAAAAAAAAAAASAAGGGDGTGYVTEKLYMLLQLYLQNKGWNPSVELLQCFSELKDTAMLPSAGYLQ